MTKIIDRAGQIVGLLFAVSLMCISLTSSLFSAEPKGYYELPIYNPTWHVVQVDVRRMGILSNEAGGSSSAVVKPRSMSLIRLPLAYTTSNLERLRVTIRVRNNNDYMTVKTKVNINHKDTHAVLTLFESRYVADEDQGKEAPSPYVGIRIVSPNTTT